MEIITIIWTMMYYTDAIFALYIDILCFFQTALQREADIAQEIPEGQFWEDPAFPADGRALYFDPECPPKGIPISNYTQLC